MTVFRYNSPRLKIHETYMLFRLSVRTAKKLQPVQHFSDRVRKFMRDSVMRFQGV